MSDFISIFAEQVRDTDGSYYYALTQTGQAGIVLLIALAGLAALLLASKKQKTGGISAGRLAFAAICLALAFVTSYIRLELPMGGSVTLFSMFFICLTGWLYGLKTGLATGFAYSLLQFFQSGGGYFLAPLQICCDYFFAFTALGIAGLWYGKEKGLAVGYTVACLTRGLFHTVGGYIYWMDYMPDWFPEEFAWAYSILYNYSYVLTEMVITLIVISLPPVKRAIKYVAARTV